MSVQFLHEYAASATPGECRWDMMIIGGGPVGLTLAAEFAGSATRVLVLESGGLGGSECTVELDTFENVGAPRVMNPTLLRARALGGTSAIWSGRCTPLDRIDLEQRSWVPFSGWPSGVVCTLPTDLARASVHLGLASHPYDDRLWREFRRPAPRFDPTRLKAHFWQYSQDTLRRFEHLRFGPRFLHRLADNVDVLLGATVTRLLLEASGTAVKAVEVASPDGARHILRARKTVLCAGGIENPRLLLNAWRSQGGPGPAPLQATGQFLMDHPRCTIGKFEPRDAAAVERFFGLYRTRTLSPRRSFTQGVALSPAIQREERLLNCAAWLTEMRSRDDPWDAMKRLVRQGWPRGGDLAAVAVNAPYVARGSWRYLVHRRGVTHKCEALHLDCLVEQVPDPRNCVTLSDTNDRFGVPLARIDWRVGALERTTVSRFASIIAMELQRLGGPSFRLAGWIRDRDDAGADMIDVAHPMGTTRMSDDPRFGVVTEDCRVHGVDNLYVAGSSVFPTAGHANPTLTALALTVRLADHIKSRA